jgi:hypothetical protein
VCAVSFIPEPTAKDNCANTNLTFKPSRMCDPLLLAGIGIVLQHATPASDGFCVVREITRGGAVDKSGYEQNNRGIRWVKVGDWLLRVNGISCQDMSRDEIKRYVVGPVGTTVELVFASGRDNKTITVQIERFKNCCRFRILSCSILFTMSNRSSG